MKRLLQVDYSYSHLYYFFTGRLLTIPSWLGSARCHLVVGVIVIVNILINIISSSFKLSWSLFQFFMQCNQCKKGWTLLQTINHLRLGPERTFCRDFHLWMKELQRKTFFQPDWLRFWDWLLVFSAERSRSSPKHLECIYLCREEDIYQVFSKAASQKWQKCGQCLL